MNFPDLLRLLHFLTITILNTIQTPILSSLQI